MLLATRRAVARDRLHLLLEQHFRQLARVGNRCAGANELRLRAVVCADAPQPPQHVGHMAAKDAPVGVELVDDHIAQPLKEIGPLRMRGQNARVKHVRVGEHNARAAADAPAFARRRIAIIDGDRLRLGQRRGDVDHPTAQPRQLVLRKRLGGKEIERARRGVILQRLEDRQVVAECLAARGGGDDDRVASRQRMLERLGLMAVESGD